ncbi:phage tail tape measure protein [Clostridium botulinum]|uniref:Phage tail tape measure protein n=1 Tax=Clostridium botulinum TaxID=1491 RepID=A0A846I2A5_CLOBO|nr:phage tail tape measure protein [Clostridium botulinum]EDT84672.1 HNH endonuclease domain protein [Clostridium botulinum Bf]NEZ93803.1 phage tail tape measure protein [Clostridium botulinum]
MASNVEKRITAKMVLDSSGFNSSLKGVNSELRNAQSQMKLASSGVQAFGKNSEKLKSVQEALSRQVELHSKKVDIYSKAIEKSKTKLDDNIKVRDKLKKSLDDANKKYENAVKTYGKESEEAKKAKAEVDKLTEEHKKAEKAVESNAKKIQNYDTNLNKAKTQMNKAQGELNKLNKELEKGSNKWLQHGQKLKESGEKYKSAGEHISKAGDKMLKLTAPIAAVGIVSSKVGMDFEAQMSKVQAISGATGEDFQKLKAKAEEMGAKTKFSAKESAEGLEYMAMAGWKTQDMLDGLPPILNLAIASGEELGATSDIVTDALTAFGLKAKDAGMFSDVLASASSNANTNVGMMGATFQYAAPVAGALGYTVQDTAIAIGLMANAGIKADKAGTAIRSGLTNLVKPTDDMAAAMDKYGISIKDSSGEMKPFRQLIGELREKLGNLDNATQAQVVSTIFGKEAMSGWLSVINASPQDVNKLTNAIDTSKGATDKMAATMSKNAKGSITEMKSALEGAGIKIFEVLAPSITTAANKISELADKFSKLDPEAQKNIVKFGAMAIATAGVTKGIGSLLIGVGNTKIALGALGLKIGATATTTATAGTTMATSAAKTGLLTKAFGGVKSAGGLAAGGVAKLAATLGISVPVLGIAAAGVAAVGFGAYKLHQNLKQDAVPAVDLFDKKLKTTKTTVDQYGHKTTVATTKLVNFTKETKKAVGAYMEIDKKASSALTSLVVNSDKFTKQAKDKVIKNFNDMSKKSSSLSNEQKNTMTTNFKKLVNDTGLLTKKNKDEIIKQYTAMVNGTKGLSKKQKEQTIKEFTDTLNKSTAITKQQSANLQQLYKDMGDKIKVGLDKKKSEELQSQQEFFSRSNVLTTTEESKILQTTTKSWEDKKKTIDGLQNQINQIIQHAANNHRQITEDEAKTIDGLQKQMKENAVKTLSTSEVEQKAILERLKSYNGRITAEQASDTIKNAEKQRQGAVDKANKQYDGTVKQIIRMRDESKVITKEQADKMLKEADRQKQGSISKANELKDGVVKQIQKMNSDTLKDIDTADGHIMSKWEKLKSWFANNPIIRWIKSKTSGDPEPQKKWTGDRYFSGGLTYLHDAPGRNSNYELYDLPRGTRIFNHDASQDLVMQTAESVATKVANSVLKGFNGSNGINVTQHIYSPVPTPSELARQSKNNLRELALNW